MDNFLDWGAMVLIVLMVLVIRPQAGKKLILPSILLAYIVYASFVFSAASAFAVNTTNTTTTAVIGASSEGPRYFIKTQSPFWKKSFGVRHIFDNGFTSDLSGIQLTLAKIFGLEIAPVQQLHVLPVGIAQAEPEVPILLRNIEDPRSALPIGTGSRKPGRAIPSDQTQWGIETIYNDSLIASTSGGAGVNVAVLDTGVLKTHPDLKTRIKECKDFTAARVPVKEGSCDDKNGHGTHVAGIILADAGADKLGIYGVAPEANLFAYKVCGNDGSCWADDVAAALKVAADSAANVVNLSLGSDSDSPLIREGIDYAVSKDVLVVAAGGNDGPYLASIDYPAANAKVVAVGAIDSLFLVPDWSSLGINSSTSPYLVEEKDMEFGAPGKNIESTWKNGGYAVLSGTSMASPHVAGLAAKFWQTGALEGTKAAATRDLLHQLAKDIWTLGDDDATGFGLPQVK